MKGASLTFVRPNTMPASTSPSFGKGFDYASLDIETSQFVQQQTGEIRVLMKRTAMGILGIGQKLIEVKKKLGHGRFGSWLSAEFDWGLTTAWQFMKVAEVFKSSNFEDLEFAPSALYELAAPSTPKAAREEALARAKAGESITYTAAKEIKQKYATPTATLKSEPAPEPELEPVSQPPPIPTPAAPALSGSKLEIIAIRPQGQTRDLEEATRGIPQLSAQALSVPQPSQLIHVPEQSGIWWRLGGRHLLYCGDPNSPEFLSRIAEEKVGLLLAFPPTTDCLPAIQVPVRFTLTENLPQRKDLRLFEDTLESVLLLCSDIGEVVVSCFLPSPEIVTIINRLERRGLFAEPHLKRCNAIISDWKKAGLKAERLKVSNASPISN